MTTIVGLDLSLTSTGWAIVTVVGAEHVAEVGTISTTGVRAASLCARNARLQGIKRQITGLAHGADLIVIEAPAYSRSNPGMHDRSGLWWIVVAQLTGMGHTVVEVTPSARAKYATGKGNAAKDAVLAAVVRRYPDVDVTGNDEADALVLAAMGARALGQPIDQQPGAHLAGMSKVAWPPTTRTAALAAAPF